jgi:hypothetical protein
MWKGSTSAGSRHSAYLTKRERGTIGGGEVVPHQVVAAAQQRLEQVERARHLARQQADPLAVGVRLAELGLDLVGRTLPHAVEPLDEHEHLGAARLVVRVQGRIGVELVEVADDRHRIDHDRAVVVEDRHQALAAHLLHQSAVPVVDHDRLEGEPLVRQREGHALDVGRERGPEQADQRTSAISIAKLAANASPGAVRRRRRPLRSASIGAVIGSKQMKSLPTGAKTCATS